MRAVSDMITLLTFEYLHWINLVSRLVKNKRPKHVSWILCLFQRDSRSERTAVDQCYSKNILALNNHAAHFKYCIEHRLKVINDPVNALHERRNVTNR